MPSLSKTASAAIAALVVSGAAAIVPLVEPGPGGAADGGTVTTTVTPVGSTPARTPAATVDPTSGTRPDEASGLPAVATPSRPVAAGRRTVLYLGDGPVLHPRGGVARSYPCRAVASLRWQCAVLPLAGAVPAGTRADVLVVVLRPRDDAAGLATTLDALPAPLRDVPTVVLAPVAVTTPATLAGHLPAIRRLASTRGAEVIDPVALHWVTTATRRTYLAADGAQPTAAGMTYLAGRLASALAAVAP